MAVTARVVGEFPIQNKRTIRSVHNPLDKSTIVSIYPKEIHEIKPTIQPGKFVIPAGNYEKPGILVIGPSSWMKELEHNQPLLEIPQNSMIMADSIIKDYCNGLLGFSSDSMPGLFFIPGQKSLFDIKKEHRDLLDVAQVRQNNWYTGLVQEADKLWARSNGNPTSISDDMRMAAQELQLKDKAWMQDFNTLELKNCPACGFMRNSNYPVCSNCHYVVDPVAYKTLGSGFAQVK